MVRQQIDIFQVPSSSFGCLALSPLAGNGLSRVSCSTPFSRKSASIKNMAQTLTWNFPSVSNPELDKIRVSCAGWERIDHAKFQQ